MLDPELEPLRTCLSQRGLALSTPLFQAGSSAVYRAFNCNFSQPVALKLQLYSTNFASELALREVDNQGRLCHDSVVRLYRHFEVRLDANWWVQGLELELMSTDLGKEICRRGRARDHWSEDQLKQFLFAMVEVLADAQKMKIAHRDIKPQNIFIDGQTFKLGDFGWSRVVHEPGDTLVTLSGTPVYLSPVLKSGLYTRSKQVKHNPFKSDVFSLGLTVLNMARLSQAAIATDSNKDLEFIISTIRYGKWVKDMLTLMLQIEEKKRPDFITLLSILKSSNSAEPCPHLLQRVVCPHCSDPQILSRNSELYLSSQFHSLTPQGMETCRECCKLLPVADLIVMNEEKIIGTFCGNCLAVKLDEFETAKQCYKSGAYFLFQGIMNAL